MTGGIQSLDGREVIWQALPKQDVAMKCPAFELLYGGSKASAKTDFLVACVLKILTVAQRKFEATGRKQMKCRIVVFRKNINDLKDFIAKTFELYPRFDRTMGTAGWHEKEKYWRFTSGATVELHHLDGPNDHESHQGNEFVAVLFDEVQYISYAAYSFLVAQVRSSDPDYQKLLMVRCTANPGGPYGDWVKKHFFIDVCPAGGKLFKVEVELATKKKITITRAFIRAFLRDNPYVAGDGTYEARLRATMSPDEVKMYLDGDFDCVSGAFFSNLIQPSVHFQRSRPISGNWDMLFSVDWGSTNPACALWGAQDNDGRVWVIDELHCPGITGESFGEKMRDVYRHQRWSQERTWRPEDFWGVIDKQAMDRYNGDATAAAGIMEKGFRIFQADKGPGERKTGINQIKRRLLMDRNGNPQIIIFEDRCPNLVRALKAIESSAPEDPEDYQMKSPHAHAVDALRFMLMKWPVKEVVHEHPVDAEVARWNALIQKQRDKDREQATGYRGFSTGYGDA